MFEEYVEKYSIIADCKKLGLQLDANEFSPSELDAFIAIENGISKYMRKK